MKKIGYVVLLCACLLALGGCTSSGPTEVTGPSESSSSNVSKDCPLDFSTLSYGVDMGLNEYNDRVVCCTLTNNSPYEITDLYMHWMRDGMASDEVKERWKKAFLSVWGCTSFEEIQEKDLDDGLTEEEFDAIVSDPGAHVSIGMDDLASGSSLTKGVCYFDGYYYMKDITLMDDLTPDYMEVEFTDENGESHEATYDFTKGYVTKYE